MLTDHVRNLSSSQESVFSALLFDTDSLAKVNMRVEKLLQTQSSHQAYRSQGNRLAPQSIAMSKVRQLILQSQLL